jgi:hypothetical protein
MSMSKRVYTTATGKRINIDAIVAQNEESIAIGNMRVNARGDELGPGGRIERTRERVMADYYKLNTPVATDHMPVARETPKPDLVDDWVEPAKVNTVIETPVQEPTATKPLRGSLASSVAKTQLPKEPEPKKTGPTRI